MDQDIRDRLDEFCTEFDIVEKHLGSLRLLAGMAYVLGLELEVRMSPRKEKHNEPTTMDC
jgi:hypothetical protein